MINKVSRMMTPKWLFGLDRAKEMAAPAVSTAQLVVLSSLVRHVLLRWISAR